MGEDDRLQNGNRLMLECLILGDSIAVGVGQARPACQTAAKTGITSGAYIQTLFPGVPHRASNIVISLGVNDDPSMNTLDNLRRMRRELPGAQVTWLLPGLKDDVRRAIQTVAAENRDRTVDTRSQVGPDHLHPTTAGYRMVAAWTEGRAVAPPMMTAAVPGPVQQASARPFMSLPRRPLDTRFGVAVVTPNGSLIARIMTADGRPAYAMWPPPGAAYAAIPPSSYAFGAMPPRRP